MDDKSLLLVFAYAPAGFGHLRVSDALYHGLPPGITPAILGAHDPAITFIHRLISTNLHARRAMEWVQYGRPQDVFTVLYRSFLRTHTKLLYRQMSALIDGRPDKLRTVLLVATHFGLAHQLSAIKERLQSEKKIRIILIVQVTDDSPQHIWYIPGADVLFVPSAATKQELAAYGKSAQLPETEIEVLAYPTSPLLGRRLTADQFAERADQVNKRASVPVHVAVPLSGAAVGTQFFITLIDKLHQKSSRFTFHVIAKEAPYTKTFIGQMLKRDYVSLTVATSDREAVDAYEKLYREQSIALEITKPSEQAFKALLSPCDTGGSLILFSEPVGRQEYDNLEFLKRHFLVPQEKENHDLIQMSLRKVELNDEEAQILISRSVYWRGFSLPLDPDEAASCIWWALEQGLFLSMMNCRVSPYEKDLHPQEIRASGVALFWERISELLVKK